MAIKYYDSLNVTGTTDSYFLGSVGIGATNPSYKLHNTGTSRLEGRITLGGNVNNFIEGVAGGINFKSAGSTSFSKGSSTNLIILETGEVGIGTTSPGHTLDVKGADTDNATIARFYSNIGARGSFIIKNGSGVNPSAFIGTAGGSEQLSIGTNSTEAIRIDASQNVGIGTTSPTTKLQVKGNSTYITVNNNNNNNAVELGADSSGDGTLALRDSSGNNRIYLNGESNTNNYINGGNVGIGTTSPGAKLDVVVSNVSVAPNGNSSAVFRQNANNYISILSGTNNEGGVLFGNSNDAADGWISYQNGSGNQFITFGTANSEKMRIDSSGKVGIGTYRPNEKLQVGGNIHIWDREGSTDSALYVSQGSTNTTTAKISSNGISYFNGGNVGIGTTSPVQKFHVHGGNINIQNGDGAYLTFNNGDANIVANYNESGRDLSFKTYNGTALAEKMRIDKDGALKLNTYTAGTLVSDASGNITVSSGGGTGGPYLPLAGGTMTGTSGVLMPDNFKLNFGNAPDFEIYHNSTTNVNHISSLLGRQLAISSDTTIFSGDVLVEDNLYLTDAGTVRGKIQLNSSDRDDVDIKAVSLGSNMKFFTVDAERMRINSSGNVGIGTTSPGAKLQIGSATYAPNANLGNNLLQIKSPSGYAYLTIGNGDSANATSYIGGASGFTVIGSVTDAGALSEHARITNTGNVGIGTTSPGATLQIGAGIANVSQKIHGGSTAGIQIFTGGGSGTKIAALEQYFSNEGSLQLHLSGTSKIRLRANGDSFLNGGNVGIGTASPSAPLDVRRSDTSGVAAEFHNSVGYGINVNVESDGGNNTISSGTNQSLSFVTNGGSNERMRIATAGNVGIGTSSPNEKLQVAGNIHAYAPSGVNAEFAASTAAGSTTVAIRSSGVTHFNGGNVGIGTTAPSTKLHLADSSDVYLTLESTSATTPEEVAVKYSNSATGEYNWWEGLNQSANWSLGYGASFSGSNTKLLVTSSGNVGIGTTTPSEKLDVNGTVNLTNLKIATAQGTDGQVLTSTGSGIAWEDAGGGSGTVTSIAAGTGLTGGTITTSGTIALDYSGNNNFILSSGTQLTSAADDDVLAIVDVGGSREVKYIEKEDFLEDQVTSVITGEPNGSDSIINIVSLTQAEYDAGTPVATTLYIIT